MPNTKPTKEEIISTIFELIKKSKTSHIGYDQVYFEIYGENMSGRVPRADEDNGNLLLFIVADMLRSGIFVEGPCYNARSCGAVPGLVITDRGRVVANSGNWMNPNIGPDNYVKKVMDGIQWIDAEIKPFVYEAFSSWYSSNYLATTTLIGVSSEFIIDDLSRELLKLFPNDSHIKKATGKNVTASERITQLQDFFNQNKTIFSVWNDLRIDTDDLLDTFANQFRIIRNRVAHSRSTGLNPERAYMALHALVDFTIQLNRIVIHLNQFKTP